MIPIRTQLENAIDDVRDEHRHGETWARAIADGARVNATVVASSGLMGIANLIHRAGNRIGGGGWYDDCAQAYAGGFEEGRRVGSRDALDLMRLGYQAGRHEVDHSSA